MVRGVKYILILSLALSALGVSAAERPNILIIFTDDQGYGPLGRHGHPWIRTPNLNKLYDTSTRFTRFLVSPTCAPTRSALMTGRHPMKNGVTHTILERERMTLKATILPQVLKQAGYTSGIFGKWHLGVPDKFHPTKTGFDYFMGFRTGGNKVTNPTLEVEGKNQKVEGFTYDILTDDALEFIERNQKKTFLLCLHYRAPHAAWMPQPESDRKPFDKLDPKIPNPDYPNLDVARVKRMTREYLGSVKGVDRNVGRVLKLLDDLKLADNTIVVFTSDHGYSMGHNGIWHKGNGHWVLKPPPPVTNKNIPRGQRPNMYDNSIFVPTAVRWPGQIGRASCRERV